MKLLSSIIGLSLALASQPVPTRTIIDVLNASPQFSELIELLQHHGLVPVINESWNSTMLAPVNSAFIGIDKSSVTRDQLLYHLINATAYSDDFATTTVYRTYLDDGNAPISLSLASGVNNEAEFDDLDLLASPQRGLVHSLSSVLDIPPTMSKQLYMDSNLDAFASLLDDDSLLNGCTVFAPVSSGIRQWLDHSLEGSNITEPVLEYLKSPFGKKDRALLIGRHVHAGLLGSAKTPETLELLDGTAVSVYPNLTVKGDGFEVNADSSIMVARNGLFVEVDGVLADNALDFLDVTPQKVVLGLGGYSFVRTLALYGHLDLLDDLAMAQAPQVVVVPNGVGGTVGDWAAHRKALDYAPSPKVADPSAMILYQFLNGEIPESTPFQLLDSKMHLRSGQYHQRVHFERRRSGGLTLNWEELDPIFYKWGNTSFYTSAELLTAPPSLTMALGPLLISSYSLSFLDKLNRLQLSFDTSWTLFVPTREAWERNMLLKNYLDHNTRALARVFDNLILQSPIYSDSTEIKAKQYSGLDTEVAWNEEFKQFTLKNKELRARLDTESTDALFDNGVAHIVNTIPLPTDLEISTSDLIDAGDRSHFLELLKAADMRDVLEPAANFTVLVPPTKDLLKNNYTVHMDKSKLQAMLKLHLIPENPMDLLFDGESVTTLAGEALEVHAIGPLGKLWGLGPVSATNGQQVLLYEYGETNGVVSGGSTVLFTDRHISPQWIIPIHFGLRKGTYAIFGMLLGLVLASALVFGLIWRISWQSREPAAGDEEERTYYRDESEEPEAQAPEEGAGSGSPQNASTAQNSEPIETPAVNENRAYGRHLNLPE